MQGVVDDAGRMGLFVLTGSQNLSLLSRVTQSLAGRPGQLLNMQALGSDAGVSYKTVEHWLSILETCYLIHYLRPHSAHFGKRLIRMPKLYMTDVGLAAALIGIRNESQVMAHPLRGALFETPVAGELLKSRCNAGLREPQHFWRDNIGTEVDVMPWSGL
jgi:predicted AAA+ superfamily ATPase